MSASGAWSAYTAVMDRFANDGPFVVDAAARQQALLTSAGKDADAVAMYSKLWSRLKPPANLASRFATQSNWHRVGLAYASTLDRAGRSNEAESVRRKLGVDKTRR